MAISVACPACERELKVKEELAGRKVKCPGCGSPIAVPQEDVTEAVEETERPRKKPRSAENDSSKVPAAKKKRAAADEEAGDEEERPRKKKQKKKSNLALWIGAGVGAVLLLGCLIGVIVLIVNNTKEKPRPTELAKMATTTKKEEPPPPKDPGTFKPRYNRWKLLQQVQHEIKQIALMYQEASTISTSGKVNIEELKKSIKRLAPGIAQEFEDGNYVLVPGAKAGGKEIVVYEYHMDDKTGRHVVGYNTGEIEPDGFLTHELEAKLGKKVR